MMKRNDNNLWGLPAGSTEINEHPELTAMREIREETGLIVEQSNLQLLHVFGGEDFFYIYPNGDQCSNIVLSYFVEKFSGNLLTTTSETISAQFFPSSDLPEEVALHEK